MSIKRFDMREKVLLEEIKYINTSHGGTTLGENKLDFSSNVNPLGPPPLLHELLREAIHRRVYTYFSNEKKIAETIAEFEDLNPDDLIALPGASFAIHFVFRELEQDAAIVIMQDLTYTDYYVYSQDKFKVTIRSVIHNNKIELNIEELEHVLNIVRETSKKILVIIVTPNNPTGTYTRLESILKLAEQYSNYSNVKFILDLSFIDFVQNSKRTLRKILEYTNIYLVKSYTKILSSPGLRIGVLAVKNCRKVLRLPSWPISSICEYIICRLFNDYRYYIERYIQKTQNYISFESRRVINKLRELGLKVYDTDVHFFLLRDSREFDKLLTRYGIVVKKICTLKDDTHLFRISIRNKKDNDVLISMLSCITRNVNHLQDYR